MVHLADAVKIYIIKYNKNCFLCRKKRRKYVILNCFSCSTKFMLLKHEVDQKIFKFFVSKIYLKKKLSIADILLLSRLLLLQEMRKNAIFA